MGTRDREKKKGGFGVLTPETIGCKIQTMRTETSTKPTTATADTLPSNLSQTDRARLYELWSQEPNLSREEKVERRNLERRLR